MINSVALTGRLTKDVDLRYSPQGVAVARFTLAVNRSYDREKADYIQIICFKKTAESVANHMKKGSLVGVSGRVQTSSWEKDGQRHFKTEIAAEQITFLESRNSQGGGNNTNNNSGNYENDPFSNDNSIDIKDSDLPF
ncbi:single-stranded DNA-binding protein [Shouchella lehensis]|uniref:Single-stranded DNA-binding protein n=1 Tax=Shouchella lehensis TaxID=300825 RepID=A0A4Y7WIF0_9BACI|nr:single-stranded DNA-binding protein [Shouchella lehensis]MBG9785609.1 single-stranded DNA-binding protein [Shouchella lehensis]TES48062.1 single-stranded DNA-binding protein [Shouchella lehensis]